MDGAASGRAVVFESAVDDDGSAVFMVVDRATFVARIASETAVDDAGCAAFIAIDRAAVVGGRIAAEEGVGDDRSTAGLDINARSIVGLALGDGQIVNGEVSAVGDIEDAIGVFAGDGEGFALFAFDGDG